jgi:hypothetical protein
MAGTIGGKAKSTSALGSGFKRFLGAGGWFFGCLHMITDIAIYGQFGYLKD